MFEVDEKNDEFDVPLSSVPADRKLEVIVRSFKDAEMDPIGWARNGVE